jgi:hypothetical protein
MAGVLTVVGLVLVGCGSSGSGDSMESVPLPPEEVLEEPGREIIRNANMSVRVDDVTASVASVKAIAQQAEGRVSNESINTTGDALYADITVRVPAEDLDAVIDEVSDLGTVMSVNVFAEDVTAQGADLDARIAALQTSIDRLTQLLATAETTQDLIEIEGELTERQAELDSLTAQREALSELVALSTLSVYLEPSSEAAQWSPPGFLSGLESGWNALRTTIAGLITVAGFALPFLIAGAIVVIPIVVLVVWLNRRRHSSADRGGQA